MERVLDLEVGEKFNLPEERSGDLYQVVCEIDLSGNVFCKNLTTGLHVEVNGYAGCRAI